jgi:plastocyanin
LRRRPTLLLTLPLLAATARIALGANASVTAGADTAFHPETVTIDVGEKVTWSNAGGPHTVVGDDGTFGNAPADPSSSWTYEHTFPTAGTYSYHCGVHGIYMAGTVIVGTVSSNPGTVGFTAASYSVNEGAGPGAITVQRTGGDDGAVAVQYGVAAGTATAGSDFTAATGTLTWANGDSSAKTFNVAIANDSTAEGSETVALSLSNPTGGLALDPAHQTGTLTIVDNDSAPGGAPAAPSNLAVVPDSTTEIDLAWTDNSNNEVGFLIERRTVGEAFHEVGSTGPNATSYHDGGLDPSTYYLYRVRASGGATSSAYSNQASAATLGNVAACVPGGDTLCLNGGRFQVELEWRIPDGTSGTGHAVPVASAPDSGLFYFFSPSNLEMLIKILNACVPSLGNRYWTFFAATTNVEFVAVVTDTQTGRTKPYYNPLNRPAPPVQDTDGFATCP